MENKRAPEIRFAGFSGEWEKLKLEELIEISSAARVHKNEWTTSGVRFFRSSDVISNYHGTKNTPAFISYSLYEELSNKSGLVQPGDILVTGGGTIGVPYLITDRNPLYFKDADILWLKSANKINGYFLYFYFLTSQLQKYISSITHIGTISHYTITQAKDTPIILPEIVEQTKIGEFLNQLNEFLDIQQQELETLKQLKQGFLQRFFSKDLRFKDKEGSLRTERKYFKLGELVDIYKGKSLGKKDIAQEGVNSCILYGELFTRYKETIRSIHQKTNREEGFLTEFGDILMPTSDVTPEGLATASCLLVDDVYVGGDIIVLRPNKEIDSVFLSYQINYFKKDIIRKVTGTSVKHIYPKDVVELEYNIPPIDEQKRIGSFLMKIDKAIALHEQELDTLKETKKAFLQKMFV